MKWLVSVLVVFLVFCASGNAQNSGISEEPGIVDPGALLGTETLQFLESSEILSKETTGHAGDPDPPDPHYPVQHAGLVRNMMVEPLPLMDSDHELMFNVSWQPPLGPHPTDYSLEVHSETDTEDCRMTMCYEYNIPGSVTWWTIPTHPSPVPETCAVRPGCAYAVKLLAHPWDGHTVASLRAQLDECVSGVCSCAHAPRLPAPLVQARTVTMEGQMFVNVSWTLPPPTYPQRLPKGLQKQFYSVSIGQQMVSDAHPSPWFARKVTRRVPTDGPIATGDSPRFFLLPTVEKTKDKLKTINVKLLARVSVVDERSCIGPAGNATAYDPAKASKVSIDTYILWILWAGLGGALALCLAGAAASGAGAAKRVLRALRPVPVSSTARDAWFSRPLISDQGSSFTSKEFETYCKESKIRHVLNAVASPRANGQVERYNRTILDSLTAFTDKIGEKNWDKVLGKLQWGLNNTLNKGIGKAPSEALFGIQLVNKGENMFAEVLKETRIPGSLQEIREGISNHIEKDQLSQKSRYDKTKLQARIYKVGDLVKLLKPLPNNDGKSKKLLPKFTGPFKITKVLGNDRYEVSSIEGSTITQRDYCNTWAADRIKPWITTYDASSSGGETSSSQDDS